MFPKINKKRKSRNILIVAAAFFLIFAFVSVHSVHALSFPTGITNYVALNISNSQSTATPNPFQQMINITSADNGWTYLNTNQTTAFGENVEFFYANGTIIPSWLENYTSGHALWWVKTGSIAASSTLTIYMGFANKTTNLFNNKTTGEAPQLSSTYGKYDNGADVFIYYQRWGGLSALPTNWANSGLSSITYQATSITLEENVGTVETITYPYTISYPVVMDSYINMNAGNLDTGTGHMGIYDSQSSGPNILGAGVNTGTYALDSPSSGNSNVDGTFPTYNVVLTANFLSDLDISSSINYGTVYSLNSTTSESYKYIGFDLYNGGGQTETFVIYWTRLRAYPPNGIMPSVSFGSVQQVAITLYLNGVSDANTSITYGTESNFTAVIPSSTDYVSLYVNGTKVVSLTQGKAVYLKTLAAGLYKITAATNTSGVNNQTYYEKISKASDYLSLSSSPNVNYTYNGTKANITAKVLSDLNNQLKNITFKVNNITVKTFNSTAVASYLNAVPGTYTAVINSSGNQNYSSETLKLTIVISKANPLTAYYLFKTEAGLKNVTAYTTEPLSNMITSNAVNNLSVSFYVEYPNGTLSEWQAGYIDKQGNISFADFVSKLNAVGTYKFYVSVAGNER